MAEGHQRATAMEGSGDAEATTITPDDLAAALYCALVRPVAEGGAERAASLVRAASAAALRTPSRWEERVWSPSADGRRRYVGRGGAVAAAADALYATLALTPIHVLAAHSHTSGGDGALWQALHTTDVAALCSISAGRWPDGTGARWLPLHLAAAQNSNVEAVQLLLDRGGAQQLDAQSSNGSIPLHYAAEQNSNVEVVRLLLERGGAEQLAARTDDGRTPLHLAAQQNSNVEVVRLLLERGGAQQLDAQSSTDCTPLHYAACSNSNVEVVRLLLERGEAEQLDAQGDQGFTPLHYAAQQNSNVEVVRLLLGRGCSRSSTSHWGDTPLSLALRAPTYRIEALQLLVEAGAALDYDIRRLPASLHAAASSVSVSSVLLSYFADNVTALGAAY
jgi:ankyrin repeat protein